MDNIQLYFWTYEIDKSILKRNFFNKFYKSLITCIIFFSINEFLGLISKTQNFFYIEFNYLLFLTFFSFLIQIFLNLIIKDNLTRTENWIFLDSSNNSEKIKELSRLTRIKINAIFMDFPTLKKANLKDIDGIVIDRFKEIIEIKSSFFYKLKQNNIKFY